MCSRILIVDDDRLTGAPEGAVWAQSSTEAIHRMQERRRWDVLYLDHDLGPGDDGTKVLAWLEEQREAGHPIQFDRVFIHSMNPAGADTLYRGMCRLYPTRRIPLPFKRETAVKRYDTGAHHAPGQPSNHPTPAESFGGH